MHLKIISDELSAPYLFQFLKITTVEMETKIKKISPGKMRPIGASAVRIKIGTKSVKVKKGSLRFISNSMTSFGKEF